MHEDLGKIVIKFPWSAFKIIIRFFGHYFFSEMFIDRNF